MTNGSRNRKTRQRRSVCARSVGQGRKPEGKQQGLWKDAVMMVELNDDTDAGKLLEETKKVYERKLKSYIGEGATPYGGTQRQVGVHQDTEEAKAKREAFKARMEGMGRLPKREH